MMPRPTGRGFTLLGLAAGTYLAGRVVGTWELYLIAFALLAAVIVSWFLVAAVGRRIRVARVLAPERPVDGDEPELSLRVENASFLPGPHLTLRNQLKGIAERDVDVEVGSLRPREQQIMKARIGRVNRGVHTLPAALAIAEDPLGIASTVHKAGPPSSVTVYPRIALLESCVLYPEMVLRHDWGGRHGFPAPGASEFKGVRPHQPGEPLSHIDWKSTAKTGVLMLREMEEPAGADFTLLLDGTADRVVGGPPNSNFELGVRVAGSIADFALRAGRGVSLLRHEHSWHQTRLTADQAGRRTLMEALAETRPNASAPLASGLRHLHIDGRYLLRSQSVTIVSLSLEQQLVRALISLREEGMRLMFVYVVGASFAQPDRGGDTSSLLPFLPPRESAAAASTRSASAVSEQEIPLQPDNVLVSNTMSPETRSLLLSLSSAGIACLTLSKGDDLVRALSVWGSGRKRATAS